MLATVVVLVVGAVVVDARGVNEYVRVLGGVADAKAEAEVEAGVALRRADVVSLLVIVLVKLLVWSLGKDVHVLGVFELGMECSLVFVLSEGQELLGVGNWWVWIYRNVAYNCFTQRKRERKKKNTQCWFAFFWLIRWCVHTYKIEHITNN